MSISAYLLYSQFIGPNAYIRLHGRNANAWYTASPEQNGCAYAEGANVNKFHSCKRRESDVSGRYDYEYSEGELKEFVPVVHVASEEGRKVQVYFNNHPNGNGTKNAMQLRGMINL